MVNNRPTPDLVTAIPHDEYARGDELWVMGRVDWLLHLAQTPRISVMLAAGLLAKKAVEPDDCSPDCQKFAGTWFKVVTEYLERTGTDYLNQLGFNLVGYGCTTCISNSGPLDPAIEQL